MTSPHDLKFLRPIPVLPSADIDRSLGWYTQLGFKLAGKHAGFLSLLAGDTNIYLRERSVDGFPLSPGEVIVLLEVGDATKLHAHVVGQQLDVTYGPHGGDRCEPKPWGFCQFSLLDPDANLITFASHLTDDDEEPQVQAPSVPDL